MSDETKYTLLTNITFIQSVNKLVAENMRLNCHALLLEEGIENIFSNDEKYNRIRGFGADAAWPVFTQWLTKGPLSYTVTPAENRSVMFLGNGEKDKPKPIFCGCTLAIANGPTFFVQIENEHHPLDVYTWSKVDGGDITRVWYELEIRCATYWKAPYMPHSSYGPPSRNIEQAKLERRS